MFLRVLLENATRAFFLLSAILIGVSFAELAVQFFGASLIGNWYSPGRLLEIAATLLVMAIALLLREIRNELRSHRSFVDERNSRVNERN